MVQSVLLSSKEHMVWYLLIKWYCVLIKWYFMYCNSMILKYFVEIRREGVVLWICFRRWVRWWPWFSWECSRLVRRCPSKDLPLCLPQLLLCTVLSLSSSGCPVSRVFRRRRCIFWRCPRPLRCWPRLWLASLLRWWLRGGILPAWLVRRRIQLREERGWPE